MPSQFKTLRIRFGGLCMFVQREADPAGLYVLMPSLKHAGMKHCVIVDTLPENTPGHQPKRLPLEGEVLDFSLLKTAGQKVSRLAWVVDVSKYTGDERIAAKWLTQRPHGALAARVRLPLGLQPVPFGDPYGAALLDIDGVPDPDRKFGQADVVITLDKPDTPRPDLPLPGGVTLTPDTNGEIFIRIFNARLGELKLGKRRKHSHGEPLPHAMSYYTLLEHYGSVHEPQITAGEDVDGDTTPVQDVNCPTGPETLPPDTKSIHAIDPYNCTLGGGCPPDAVQC